MQYKAPVGKQVRVGRKVIEFKDGTYTTEDKAEQEALSKAKNVEKASARGGSKASSGE